MKASCIIERRRGIQTVWKVLAGLVIVMVASLAFLVVHARDTGAATAASPSRLQDELPTVKPETDTVPSETNPGRIPKSALHTRARGLGSVIRYRRV